MTMRPYLAIIKDSFREALASRVLWMLLIAITIFLLVLAPVGMKQMLSTNFTFVDLRDPAAFVDLLKGATEKPEQTPAKRVWERFDKGVRADLERARASLEKSEDPNVFFRMSGLLTRELNKLLPQEDLYSADVWKGVRLNEEARGYLDKDFEKLANDERLRRNRVLLETAFPDQFVPQPQKSLAGTYLFLETPAVPIQQSSVRALIEEVLLSNFLSWIVATVGVLVAIVVTASIIPQMFDPGSLHLLLSKPVNRSFLFLAKFFGGCAFTLVNVGYLLAGLWLILGLRFGIWNVGLFYCIPIFLFIFSIYYAVSALASVIWRNAIVSVMITVVFWGLCFLVGLIKVNVLDGLWIKPARIVKLIPAEESLLALSEGGEVSQWNEEERQWQEVFLGPNRGAEAPMYVGPLFDAKHQQLVGVNSMGQGKFQIPVQLAIGKRNEGWRRVPGVRLPGGVTVEMFLEPEQNRKAAEKDQPGVLVVSTNGLFRFTDVPARKIVGIEIPFGSGPQFVPVAADADLYFNNPLSAAMSEENGRVAVYSRGEIQLFAPNAEGKYVQKQESKLDVAEDQGAVLAFAGSSLLVAHEGGKVLLLDGESLSIEAEFKGERRTPPRFVAAAPYGKRFAIVYQNGNLWMLDVEAKSLRRARVSGQGNIYAAVFKGSNRLLVADRSTRVSEYTADTYKLQDRITPKLSTVEQAYWYGVNPLYFVFPRPGEFGYTMQYALTGKEASTFTINMQMARDSLNPWRPVWNGLIFMFVMLGLACVYIERQEF